MFVPTTESTVSSRTKIPPAQRAALACRACGALYAGFVGIGPGRCQLCQMQVAAESVATRDHGRTSRRRDDWKRGLVGFVIVLAVALVFLAFRYGITA